MAFEEKIKFAKEKLKEILSYYNVEFEEEVFLENNILNIKIKGFDLDFLTKDEGLVLNALQYIIVLMGNNIFGDYLKIVLDYDGFREKRDEKLKDLARKIILKVKEKNIAVTLEPMNPFERRLIHFYVSEFEGVYSKSVGKEPARSVVIYPLNKVE